MTVIYAKERDEFVDDVIDWLPENRYMRISGYNEI